MSISVAGTDGAFSSFNKSVYLTGFVHIQNRCKL